jgi:hypothetical protein
MQCVSWLSCSKFPQETSLTAKQSVRSVSLYSRVSASDSVWCVICVEYPNSRQSAEIFCSEKQTRQVRKSSVLLFEVNATELRYVSRDDKESGLLCRDVDLLGGVEKFPD